MRGISVITRINRFNELCTMEKDYVLIEGIPGSGKSSLLNKLAQDDRIQKNFKLISEPVDSFQNFNGVNWLQNLYENPKKYAFIAQNVFLDIANDHYLSQISEHTKKLISDRSIYSGKIFTNALLASRFLSKEEFDYIEYRYSQLLPKSLPLGGNRLVYLSCKDVYFEDLIKRLCLDSKDRYETNMHNEILLKYYFARLQEYYENYIKQFRNMYGATAMIEIDSRLSESEVLKAAKDFILRANL